MSQPSPVPPGWPHCGENVSPERPFGCTGVRAASHTACLAHLTSSELDAYLAGLAPGADLDHRDTSFSAPLLHRLLDAVRDPTTGHPLLGTAKFQSATFTGDAGFESATFEGAADFRAATFENHANFESATFEGAADFGTTAFENHAKFESAKFVGDARFGSATFTGDAGFESATFEGTARFGAATFTRDAWFDSVTFSGHAGFRMVTFESDALFMSATFKGDARFETATFEGGTAFRLAIFTRDAEFRSATFLGHARFGAATFTADASFGAATFKGHAGFESATFEGDAGFRLAIFTGDARFESATFTSAATVGPFICTGRVLLSGATFNSPVTLSFAAQRLECRRTRWSSTAEIRLRYATVDFSHAVFEYPLTIATEPDPFVLTDGRQMAETALAHAPCPAVRLASLRGVDAAHLVLADIDLSGCLFAGTVHLDQLRLEGACTFDTAPASVHWRRWLPVRFTERRVLAEEHHWRASRPSAVRGWSTAVLGAGHTGPLQLAPVYRALRKAFEDGKHEPGAADFYYGEMEMRRHADDIPRSERSLLTAYWALSGYGLRASRALAWLGATMLLTITLLMAVGLPQDSPKQTATGMVPAGGGKVSFEIGKDDPKNPTGDRFTGKRFERALNVTLNSVVFRSSGQDLTTAGTYIEMTSRLTEPVLLALAVLAVRNRVKR
ncbi:pentapeptide repeat-containing protein [Streptomyces sp. NPDC058794]|uniref:pentapeptide repeat-containing protein n=1 Tax=Streptomyces sp. NPDC058794 TaxID=3346636 RepID=UPI0036AEF8DF